MNTNNHSNYREITIHLSSTRSSEHKIDLSVIVLMEVFEFLHEVLNEPNLSGFDLDLARVRVVIHRVDLEIIGLSLRVRPSDVRVKETVQHDLKIGEKEDTGVNKAQLNCKQSKHLLTCNYNPLHIYQILCSLVSKVTLNMEW